jgi:hypothetical protein
MGGRGDRWCGIHRLHRSVSAVVRRPAHAMRRTWISVAFEHWGKGYATEASRAAVAFGFATVGLPEIVAMRAFGKTRSRRVMERLGMRQNPVSITRTFLQSIHYVDPAERASTNAAATTSPQRGTWKRRFSTMESDASRQPSSDCAYDCVSARRLTPVHSRSRISRVSASDRAPARVTPKTRRDAASAVDARDEKTKPFASRRSSVA